MYVKEMVLMLVLLNAIADSTGGSSTVKAQTTTEEKLETVTQADVGHIKHVYVDIKTTTLKSRTQPPHPSKTGKKRNTDVIIIVVLTLLLLLPLMGVAGYIGLKWWKKRKEQGRRQEEYAPSHLNNTMPAAEAHDSPDDVDDSANHTDRVPANGHLFHNQGLQSFENPAFYHESEVAEGPSIQDPYTTTPVQDSPEPDTSNATCATDTAHDTVHPSVVTDDDIELSYNYANDNTPQETDQYPLPDIPIIHDDRPDMFDQITQEGEMPGSGAEVTINIEAPPDGTESIDGDRKKEDEIIDATKLQIPNT